MALLPTPLTIVQVDGAVDVSEALVLFNVGLDQGRALLVSKTDPNLQSALVAGDVVGDPSLLPDMFISGISPSVFTQGVTVDVEIRGIGFTADGDLIFSGAGGISYTFVSSNLLRCRFPAPVVQAGNQDVTFSSQDGTVVSNTVIITVEAATP